MTDARTTALNCTAIKAAYRQSKDGFVVSFAIHPQEVPLQLANAHIGTRWLLALVEIDDNDQPKESEVMPDKNVPQHEPSPRQVQDSPSVSGGAQSKSWREMSYAQQAGILCNDSTFMMFLGVSSAAAAADIVRLRCGVTSRADIVKSVFAAKRWRDIDSDYRMWMREPEFAPSD